MRIAYCEDETAQAELVRAMIWQWADSRQETAEVILFESAEEFLFKNDKYPYDAVCEMPQKLRGEPLVCRENQPHRMRDFRRNIPAGQRLCFRYENIIVNDKALAVYYNRFIRTQCEKTITYIRE